MSKQNKETRTVRECTVTWDYNGEDGAVETKEIRVCYFSPTIAQLKADRLAEQQKIDADPTTTIWLSDVLAPSLHSLHDLPGTPSSVSPVDSAWLDEQDLVNLTRVRDAIDQDLKAGKLQPAK